jgi:hypothetical protein
MKKLKRIIQCKNCPWLVGTNPCSDIKGDYSKELHRKLRKTIASKEIDIDLDKTIHVMACHESRTGNEDMCVGWLSNQLGSGNNIRLRLIMMNYEKFNLKLIGKNHKTFEETIK